VMVMMMVVILVMVVMAVRHERKAISAAHRLATGFALFRSAAWRKLPASMTMEV